MWRLLFTLFCRKATILDADNWSDGQRGREITIYIFKNDRAYQGYMQGVTEFDHEFFLGRECEVYTAPFWVTFILELEARLSNAGVRTRGVAIGDLPLPGCTYLT